MSLKKLFSSRENGPESLKVGIVSAMATPEAFARFIGQSDGAERHECVLAVLEELDFSLRREVLARVAVRWANGPGRQHGRLCDVDIWRARVAPSRFLIRLCVCGDVGPQALVATIPALSVPDECEGLSADVLRELFGALSAAAAKPHTARTDDPIDAVFEAAAA